MNVLRGSGNSRITGTVVPDLASAFCFLSSASRSRVGFNAGAIEANVELARAGEQQSASASGSVRSLRFGENALSEATFDLTASDLFGVPAIDGSISGRDARAGGVDIATFVATASTTGPSTAFDASATLANGAEAAANGALEPEGEGFRLRLDQASLGQGVISARLTEPASLLVVGDRHRRLGSEAGRTTEELIAIAPCPVLVLGEDRAPSAVPVPPRAVVVAGLDEGPGAAVSRVAAAEGSRS